MKREARRGNATNLFVLFRLFRQARLQVLGLPVAEQILPRQPELRGVDVVRTPLQLALLALGFPAWAYQGGGVP